MLEALLRDLSELPDVQLVTTRDVRLPALPGAAEMVAISPDMDIWNVWERVAQESDAFWPIAPESGGVLERMSRMASAHGKLLGSTPEAVALAASKFRTAIVLAAAGLAIVPTHRAVEAKFSGAGPWVVKPDDGVGCEDTRYFDDADAMRRWLEDGRMQSHVVQPYVSGIAASLSMLCRDGKAWLLSCNHQQVQLQSGVFSYHGSLLNALSDRWAECAVIAAQVAAAMPGLAGYVGIDVIVSDDTIHVLEVNPRLTTSYAGLRQAIGANPARLIVDLFYNVGFPSSPMIARNFAEVRLP